MKFAKLFDIDDHQVLVTNDYDDDAEEFAVNFTTEIDGIRPTMSLKFKDDALCTKAFEDVDHEAALKMFLQLKSAVEAVTEDSL